MKIRWVASPSQKIHAEVDPTSRSFDDLTDLLYVMVAQGREGPVVMWGGF